MSVFDCSITYKKVEGDSYLSTYNKLLSQKIINNNLMVMDIQKWKLANNELNSQASAKLKTDVILFGEKKLLSGVKLVANKSVFETIDSINRNIPEVEEVEITTPSIYNILNISAGETISNDKVDGVQKALDDFNESSTDKFLSLQRVVNGYLIKQEFNYSYMFKQDAPVEDEYTEQPTDSNNNFNLPCIQ